MLQYRALVTYTVKISAGLTFEAADRARAASVAQRIAKEAAPFDIQRPRIRHAQGAIEIWGSAITSVSVDTIVEEDEAI